MKAIKSVLLSIIAISLFSASTASAARLKDIADIEGVRGNQLVGYGLIVGLQGTGDKSAVFTSQSVANMLERLGIRIDAKEAAKLSNVAAVLVTGELPPFARAGTKIDVTLSSLGDATSLQGGTLVMTPLRASDGKTYAVAQGPVSLGGFIVEGAQNTLAQKNHPTVARISNGATVEQAIPFDLFANGTIRIVLRDPDFTTVTRVQAAINASLGAARSRAIDSASVIVPIDPKYAMSPVHLIAKLEDVEINPDIPARVVINERTGTIIMGENVRVSTVALAHGSLNITIRSENQVSQPNAFGEGQTEVVQNEEVNVTEEFGRLSVLNETVSLGQVVEALNGLGATPRDMIAIFQALQEAGALQAELVIM